VVVAVDDRLDRDGAAEQPLELAGLHEEALGAGLPDRPA
jgi:hypothetical protein